MKKLTALQISEYSGGRLFCGPEDNTAAHVERDSREASAGSLFIGLIGEKNDGNDFAEAAYKNGCRTFMLSSKKAAEFMADNYKDSAVIFVDDTLKGMQNLAKNYLKDCNIKKIAVTGSTGKTSTKDMLACIFSTKYKTVKTPENFNNHIGLPLTVFLTNEETQVGIFEMGMSELGEIKLLADIIRPETAVITNIGISHLETLKSRENILKAKLEVATFMDEGSYLIYNCDNDKLSEIDSAKTVYNKIRAGERADSEGVVISDLKDYGEKGIEFKLSAGGESAEFFIPLLGRHNAWNASLAAGCALKYGISLKESAEALKELSITGKRQSVRTGNNIKIIDDTYNASPDSVKSAIDSLAALECGRRVAILADMLDLGENSGEFHREVGKYAAEKGIDLILTVGPNARYIAEGAAGRGEVRSYAAQEEFLAAADKIIKRNDGILIKGSHGMHMDKAVEYLLKSGASYE